MHRITRPLLTRAALAAAALGLLAACGEPETPQAKPTFGETSGKDTGDKPKTTSKSSEKPETTGGGETPKVFTERDTDGDGAISREEAGDKGWIMLSRADADGDGVVTPEEMKKMRENGPVGPPKAADIIGALDKDGDGAIALSDLPEAARQSMSAADTDGDGQISAEELAARQAQMRQRQRPGAPGTRRPGGPGAPGGPRPPGAPTTPNP